MKITDVKVRKVFDTSPMKAIVSVTFDDCFTVHDVKVIYANDKYFIVMPSRKNSDGSYKDIAHPINASFRAELQDAVVDAYFAQKDEVMARAAERASLATAKADESAQESDNRE